MARVSLKSAQVEHKATQTRRLHLITTCSMVKNATPAVTSKLTIAVSIEVQLMLFNQSIPCSPFPYGADTVPI
ncbi:hypothetical protein HG702_22700 (plasmid) [Pectobacterium versatile]|nr:hypothetical protein HG702_22700 [Pectobacterium versatile]